MNLYRKYKIHYHNILCIGTYVNNKYNCILYRISSYIFNDNICFLLHYFTSNYLNNRQNIKYLVYFSIY